MKYKRGFFTTVALCVSLCLIFLGMCVRAEEINENSEVPQASAADHGEGQYGALMMGVEDWNTYDEAGNPTPLHDTSDYVVAVVDSGVDYRHDDLKNVLWDEGLDYPSLVEKGGGKYGI